MHSLFKPFGFGNTQMKQNNLAEMADKLLKFSDNKSWHGVGFLPFEVQYKPFKRSGFTFPYMSHFIVNKRIYNIKFNCEVLGIGR